MDSYTFQMFDFDKFVNKLNSVLIDDSEYIGLGEFIQTNPKNTSLYYFESKTNEFVGRFPLFREVRSKGIMSTLFRFDSVERIGDLYVEAGFLGPEEDYGLYEMMRLRLKEPLRLVTGVLPNSKITLLREEDEAGRLEPHTTREDYVKKGLFWVKTQNLEKTLPTAFFN